MKVRKVLRSVIYTILNNALSLTNVIRNYCEIFFIARTAFLAIQLRKKLSIKDIDHEFIAYIINRNYIYANTKVKQCLLKDVHHRVRVQKYENKTPV